MKNEIEKILARLEALEDRLTEAEKRLPAKRGRKPGINTENRAEALNIVFRALVVLPNEKKENATFPNELRNSVTFPNGQVVETPLPIVPLSAFVARAIQRATFKPGEGEYSARDNILNALKRHPDLVQSTLGEIGLRIGSNLSVVLERDELERRKGKASNVVVAQPDFEKTVRSVPKAKPTTIPPVIESRWVSEPEEEEAPITTDTVDEEDEEEWDEDEQPENDPFADFRLSGLQKQVSEKKVKKSIDLFGDGF